MNLGESEIIYKTVATLKQGESFGELALISKKGLRAARIVADSYCCLGVLWADDYTKCLMKIEKSSKERLVEFIKEMPYFKPLSTVAVAKIVNSLNH